MNNRTTITDAPARGTVVMGFRVAALFFLGKLVLCVALGSFVPLLTWLWAYVPTLALLCIGFGAAALFVGVRIWAGVLAGIVAFALVGGGGALLRQQSSSKWAALAARDTVLIERRIQVPLLEPLVVSSNVKYVRFAPALYDSMEASCGDQHCMSFGGIERAYSWNEELIGKAVAGARLSMASADSTGGVTFNVEESSQNEVVTIQASLRDSNGTFATMRIFRPHTDRNWSSTLPAFLHVVLEHNALSVKLYPHRPEASKTPLMDFLQQAIEISAAGPAPETRVSARIVSSVSVEPRRFVMGSPAAVAAMARQQVDPACSDRLTLVPPPRGTSLGYLAVTGSSARLPYPSGGQVICRGEHLYVLTHGEWGMHTFRQYAFDGTALGTYSVGAPDEPSVTADFWRLDADSLEENGDRLSYAMDGWDRERVNGSAREEEIIHKYRQIWEVPL